jgi:hypothetical protein
MRTVRSDSGKRYVLVKRSAESSRVRDPETGEERYVPTDRLEVLDDDPLAVAARAIPADVRTVCRAARTDASLGLLLELDRRGPTSARALIEEVDRCESDLHGLISELLAAGAIARTDVAGERGYRLADGVDEALQRLRG